MSSVNVEATKKEVTKDGYKMVTRIIHNVKSMSPRAKLFSGIYLTFAFSHNVFTNYNAGKISLLKYRHKAHVKEITGSGRSYNSIDTNRATSEFEAVKLGICEDSFSRFIDSIIFPFTAISEVMPHIVMFANPSEVKKLPEDK